MISSTSRSLFFNLIINFNLFIMKSFKLLYCLLLSIPFMTSCNNDDDNNSVSFDKSQVSLIISKSDTISVKGSDSIYTAISSDTTIAKIKKIATRKMTVTGKKAGNVIVTVKTKDGKTGQIAVSVIADPFAAVKADTKNRFIWNMTSKIQGTDAGTYKTTQSTTGKVEFSWKSTDLTKTIVLSFNSSVGGITEGVKTGAKLVIDGLEVSISALEVIQSKVVNAGEKATVWIAFSSSNKIGVCVGQLSE